MMLTLAPDLTPPPIMPRNFTPHLTLLINLTPFTPPLTLLLTLSQHSSLFKPHHSSLFKL